MREKEKGLRDQERVEQSSRRPRKRSPRSPHTRISARAVPGKLRSTRLPSGSAKAAPRILLLDIETAPLNVYAWGLWEQNIGLEQIGTDWSILSFAAKWLGEKRVIQADTSKQLDVRNDHVLLGELWKLLDQADIVIAHNGKRFDIPKINARFLLSGFSPPSPFRIIDTLEVAKKRFALTSNKLAHLSKHLARAPKLEHRAFPGFELWSECLKGNPKAWRVMRAYNRRDVDALEDVYLALRPWIDGHPNVAAYSDLEVPQCPKCGCSELIRNGSSCTQVGQYRRYRCRGCGGFSRGRLLLNSKSKRSSLLAN